MKSTCRNITFVIIFYFVDLKLDTACLPEGSIRLDLIQPGCKERVLMCECAGQDMCMKIGHCRALAKAPSQLASY